MIQTGCPFGDGTGGESIWGGEFEDEFHPTLRHDRPYTVSMASILTTHYNIARFRSIKMVPKITI